MSELTVFGVFSINLPMSAAMSRPLTAPTPDPVSDAATDPNAGIRHSFADAMQDPDRFGREFYARLFALAPAIRPLFPSDMHHQRDKLVRALAMLVRGLGDTASLAPSLQQLGARHVGYGVSAPHYVVVGEALIDTLTLLSPDRMDAATRSDWVKVYGWVAATMLSGAESHAAVRPVSSATSPPSPRY
jgi:hemoglobin-like flavoprotein